MKNRSFYLLDFKEIDKTSFPMVGGKGANLGELAKITGIYVPDGFCLSTEAFKQIIAENPSINQLIESLSLLKVEDRDKIGGLSIQIRSFIEDFPIPPNIVEEISELLSRFGQKSAYAIRSSATAEDLPHSSFAGQQNTYLNIIGKDAILKHISKCWASLFTERAVIYRIQNGFEHCKVHLAVVVQKMVFPQTAGIMFTADPLTSNRKIISIDASFGLGEAMVSGLVNTDNYKVCDDKIIDQKISTKKLAIYAVNDGGTTTQEIPQEKQHKPALTEEQVLHLACIGRQIEAHFGCPQDIEWCLADGVFYMLQSRPITTLYPIPKANDAENHVYVSVGHQQMMTDALKPLGLSLFQLTAMRPMPDAGGRLFVDVTDNLASAAGRNMILNVLGKSDLLVKDALTTITTREGFLKPLPNE